MSLKAFNSIQGFSVGENLSQDIILANGDITTVNFTANGISNLGPIGNVKITGGAAGQTIITDGTGNLVFTGTSGNSAAVMPYYIPSDKSYIVPTNFQGLFTQPIEIDGELEIDGILIEVGTAINAKSRQVLFDSAGQITGNIGFTFDQSSGNLSLPGNVITSGNLLPTGDLVYSLGNATNRWNDLYLSGNTIYIGNSSISTTGGNLVLTNGSGGQIIVAGNSITTSNQIINQNSSLTVNPTNVIVSVDSVPNIGLFSTTGLSIAGTVSVTGNAIVDGILTDNYYYANGQPIDTQNPSGSNTQIQYNNNNNFGASANFTFNDSTNILTVVGNGNFSNVSGGDTVSANYLISNSGCVTIGGATIAVTGNNAGIFASLVDDINLGLYANIIMGSSTSNVTVQGNLTANGSITGTTLTGNLVTGAQPNITSIGTLSNLSVTGNINTGNITVTNTVDAVNIKVTDLFSKRTSINIGTQTPIDTFPITSFRSAKYTMRAGDGTDYQALEVLLVHNNINSLITVYGSLSTSGTDLVVFDTDISAGNVNVYATAVSPNTNLNLMGTYVPD